MAEIASGSIDLKSLGEASKVANNLFSADDSGIMVYNGSEGIQMPSNPNSETNNVFIDDDSLDIRRGSNVLARFNSSGIAFYDKNEITLAEFGSSGAIIGAEEATSRAKFTSDGFEIEDDNLLTIVKMGKGETLWNHYKESVYIGRVVANAKEDENDVRMLLDGVRYGKALKSPIGEINFSIPWAKYTIADALEDSGVLSFQFDSGVSEIKYDEQNVIKVEYQSNTNRIYVSTLGNYYQSYVRYHSSEDWVLAPGRRVTILNWQPEIVETSSSSLYMHAVIGFTNDSERQTAFSTSLLINNLPSRNTTKNLGNKSFGNYNFTFYLQNFYDDVYRFQVELASISPSNMTYGTPVIVPEETYMRISPRNNLRLNGPISLDYYGTSEAPYYSFGQRGEGLLGAYSFTVGQELIAENPRALAIGKYNADSEDYAIQVGNGESDNARSNAFTVDWSGNIMAQGMAGQIIMYAGPIVQSVSNNVITTTAPAGYLLCDGSVVLVDDYPELAAVLGTTYGGDGTTTFGLPDFRGRTGVGVGTGTSSTATAHTLGQTAGSERVTLTTSTIPAHTHGSKTISGKFRLRKVGNNAAMVTASTNFTVSDYSGTGTGAAAGSTSYKMSEVEFEQSHTHNSVGDGEAHNNMQPYIGINYIIATGKTY